MLGAVGYRSNADEDADGLSSDNRLTAKVQQRKPSTKSRTYMS